MDPTLLTQDPSSNPDLATAINRLADAIAGQALEAPVEEVAAVAEESGHSMFSLEWFQDLGTNGLEKLKDLAPHLAAAIAVLLIGWMIAKFVRNLLRKVLLRSKVDTTLVNFSCSVVYMAFMVFVVMSALGKLGVDTTSFIAILGAATFAIGFALQGSLSNFAAGILMIIFRPIRNGDLVEAGGVLGEVQEVGVFATIINTLDNKKAIVSNGNIMSGNIINYTANGKLRVDMTFGIGYSDDLDKAITIMRKVLNNNDKVLKSPEPDVFCSEHGDSSVNFVCRPYVKPEHYWDVWFATHKQVKEEFDRQGVSIPFPQRDVHMIPGGPTS